MPLTAEQIKERLGYIGGSDAAAVMGMSRWASPLSVWAEKTEQLPPREVDSEAADLGQELEDYVARRFMKKTGKVVQRVNDTIFHPKYPFLAANIDRRVVGEKAILECKTASAWKAKEWEGEEIPREYIIQVMHYLAITGAERAYIAVLIGNQSFQWKVIERDEKALADLVSREVAFWNDFVVPKVMPASFTAGDGDTLSELFPNAEIDDEVTLDDRANALAESLESMGQDYRNLEKQIEKSKNELKAMLGKAERGTTGLWDFRWANVPETVVEKFTKKAFRKFTYKRKEEKTNG